MAASDVTIYSTNWCAFCKTEKQYLDHLEVEYNEKNIEEDEAAMKELLDKNNGQTTGVPVTDIAGELIFGFDRAKIDSVLREKGLLASE